MEHPSRVVKLETGYEETAVMQASGEGAEKMGGEVDRT